MEHSTSISDTAARPDGSARRLWQHADFLKLLAGEAISDIGSQIGDLALPVAAALVLNATPGQMAALRAAEYVPRIVIGLVALILAWVQHRREMGALRAQVGGTPYSLAGIMAGLIAGLGVIALVIVALRL